MANKAFDDNKTVLFLPVKVMFDNMWVKPLQIEKYYKFTDCNREFHKMVNNFEYYNCNNQLGYYTKFYIET